MVRSARPISPVMDTTLAPQTSSPVAPTPSKGRKMSICFECESRDCICGYQGRNAARCFECERWDCVCSCPSNESLSITSEDDLPPGGLRESKQGNLSFISADEEEQVVNGSSPPSATHEGDQMLEGESHILPPPHPSCRQTGFQIDRFDRQVNVADYRPMESNVSCPDLCVFSVYSAQQVTIAPQEVAEVQTNIIIHPEHAALEQHPALFNFCPLGLESKNTTLAVKACQMTGGAIYTGHQTSKRLCIRMLNPGSFAPLSFPKSTMLGVLEIYYTRY